MSLRGTKQSHAIQGRLAKFAIASVLAIIWILFAPNLYAQSQYDNTVFRPEIKSVEFYNTAKQASFPLIKLSSDDKLLLAFDDLQGGSKNFYYSIEHCDANWNSSNLAPADFLGNYTDDHITSYSYSTTTVQKYTHYQIRFPNENISPKISGNYVLKVYEDGDLNKMVLTRRFYVLNSKVKISAEVVPSNDVALRQTNQKLNFTVDYNILKVQNPATDLRTFVMQNNRYETGIINTQPASIRGTQLIYSDVNTNDFASGNEFRHIDTRTLKLNSQNITRIVRDTANNIFLLTDPDLNQPNYTLVYDLDGAFYIINQDGADPRTDADYTYLYFSLSTKKQPKEGSAYIVGQFNDYKLDEGSKLVFDAANGKYVKKLYLKQGVYDYTYVWVDKTGKVDNFALEGSHFETENNYQLLVYYRPAGARWDELAGYQAINTVTK